MAEERAAIAEKRIAAAEKLVAVADLMKKIDADRIAELNAAVNNVKADAQQRIDEAQRRIDEAKVDAQQRIDESKANAQQRIDEAIAEAKEVRKAKADVKDMTREVWKPLAPRETLERSVTLSETRY